MKWVDMEHISLKEIMQLKVYAMFKDVVKREQRELESCKNGGAPLPQTFERRLTSILESSQPTALGNRIMPKIR